MSVADISSILPEALPALRAIVPSPGAVDTSQPGRREADTVPTVDDSGTPADAGAALSAFLVQIRNSSADEPTTAATEADQTGVIGGADRSARNFQQVPLAAGPATAPDRRAVAELPAARSTDPRARQTRSSGAGAAAAADASSAATVAPNLAERASRNDEALPLQPREAAPDATPRNGSAATDVEVLPPLLDPTRRTPTLAEPLDARGSEPPQAAFRDEPPTQAIGATPPPAPDDPRALLRPPSALARSSNDRPAGANLPTISADTPRLRDADAAPAPNGRSVADDAGSMTETLPARPPSDAFAGANGSTAPAEDTRQEPLLANAAPRQPRDANLDPALDGRTATLQAGVTPATPPARPPSDTADAIPPADRAGGASRLDSAPNAAFRDGVQGASPDLRNPVTGTPAILDARTPAMADPFGPGTSVQDSGLEDGPPVSGPTLAEKTTIIDHRPPLLLREPGIVPLSEESGAGASAGAALSAFLIQVRDDPSPSSTNGGDRTPEDGRATGFSSPSSGLPAADVRTPSASNTETRGPSAVTPADLSVLTNALLASGLLAVATSHGATTPAEDVPRLAGSRVARIAQVSGSAALTARNGGSGNSLLKHAREAYAVGDADPDLDAPGEVVL